MKNCFLYQIQHQHFTAYLQRKCYKKYLDIKYLIPERLNMEWQTKFNSLDCGIFAIIHMESYMGGGTKNWISNLLPESVSLTTWLYKF